MRKIFFLLLLALPLFTAAQQDTILPAVYKWQDPGISKSSFATKVLFEGKTYDMEWLQMTANNISPKSRSKAKVDNDEEQLLMVKSGILTIIIRDSTWSLTGGSAVLLMPKEKYIIANKETTACSYYIMRYRPKSSLDRGRGQNAGGSIVRDWNKLPFIRQDRGGRRNYFERPTAACRRFEMHVTTLKEGLQSHDPHMHRAAEIILVIEGDSEMLIGDKNYQGSTGDVYYMSSNILHGIKNIGKGMCTYFAFQFE